MANTLEEKIIRVLRIPRTAKLAKENQTFIAILHNKYRSSQLGEVVGLQPSQMARLNEIHDQYYR